LGMGWGQGIGVYFLTNGEAGYCFAIRSGWRGNDGKYKR
jgi:hypothetical protein